MTPEERIAALEARLAAAEARIATLEAERYMRAPAIPAYPTHPWYPAPTFGPVWTCGADTKHPDLRQVNAAGAQP